jgi:amidase
MKRLPERAFLLVAFTILALPAVARAAPFQIVEASIADIQAQYRAGKLSPEDVVRMYLDRINTFDRTSKPQPLNGGAGNQPLNSFMHVGDEAALRAARELGEDRDDGEGDDDARPLFGIPVILKDNIATQDMPTTAGSVALGASRPEKDATIARKLRRAGAIILGKGTLTEFANFIALRMPSGYSSQLRFQLFQVQGADLARVGYGYDPYDTRLDTRPGANDGRPAVTPGGSSSGPGIAVAANLATVGVGTETSGSILSPSSANMLVGIKPTLGLVSRHGIVPITADQDTAGPLARTVTDAAKLLGVLAGFDEKDPATRDCLKPGNCLRDYTKFLKKGALHGAVIAVPKNPYWTSPNFGLTASRRAVIERAIADMTDLGATFIDCDIPSQAALSNFGTCVTTTDVTARRANQGPNPAPCSTVLLNGFKNHLNAYLADKDFGPGVSVSNSQINVRTIHNLSEVIAFNKDHADVALKYGQAIAEGADFLTTQQDVDDYRADRDFDLLLTRTCGLDILFNGGDVPQVCIDRGLVDPTKIAPACKGKMFDAVLFPANFGANPPARAGYPSVAVPAGMFQFTTQFPGFDSPPFSPIDVTLTGPRFSEGRLIGFAYDYEQATHRRTKPPLMPVN